MGKDYNNMTPIELNVLISKTKDKHEDIKQNIYKYLDEVDILTEKINLEEDKMKHLEDTYVKLIAILMEKQ